MEQNPFMPYDDFLNITRNLKGPVLHASTCTSKAYDLDYVSKEVKFLASFDPQHTNSVVWGLVVWNIKVLDHNSIACTIQKSSSALFSKL